jgi:AcrR family transcriptional regulator
MYSRASERRVRTVPDLDLDRIADAALAVADERGAAGFTMRAVAEALGVTPMALYHHVADKAALVLLLVDKVVASVPLPDPTGMWQEDLWQFALWMREIVNSHPAVSQLSRSHQVLTRNVLPFTERWINLWQQSGLSLDDAIRAAATSSMALIGLVEQEVRSANLQRPDPALLTHLPSTRMSFERIPDRDADFELIVRSLLEGLHARLSEPGERR